MREIKTVTLRDGPATSLPGVSIMPLRVVWPLLRDTITEWREDKASRLAAALAYYTLFSLAPLLLIVISIVGLAFGQEAAQGRIVEQIEGLVGRDAAVTIQRMVDAAGRQRSGLVGALGVVVLLIGAGGAFAQLREALNTIWDAPPPPRRGLLATVRAPLFSFAILVATGFLLLVSLVISAGLSAAADYLRQWLAVPPVAVAAAHSALAFAVVTVLFALIYTVLPDVEISWRHVWVGAAITALLFILGKFLIGLYLGRSAFASTYGAAGSIVVVLLWVYYSAQILLFGAEFTQVYAKRYTPVLALPPTSDPEVWPELEAMPASAPPPAMAPEIPTIVGLLVGIMVGLGALLEMRAREAAPPPVPGSG